MAAATKTSAPTAPAFGPDGKRTGEFELPATFDTEPNVPVMHAVVRAQLAAARAGTSSTKTRGEVRGGGVKPWRQKGTGRARHGSIREPQWVGGGVAHGPKPRSYDQRISKKEKALALHSALTVRARAGAVRVIDLPELEHPQTKRAVELLRAWEAGGKVLLIVGPERVSDEVWLSFRNLANVQCLAAPTAYSVLACDTLVINRAVLEAGGDGEAEESPAAAEAKPSRTQPKAKPAKTAAEDGEGAE